MSPILNSLRIALMALLAGATLVVSLRPRAAASQEPTSVRLALVNVPDDVLRPLLPDFQRQTGMSAEIVYTGNNPFAVAREGKADLVISHYGHPGVQPFITAGLGLWPHTVFANTYALIGPPSDPAHVRGLADGAEAFRRIAQTKSTFVVNNAVGGKYIENILWSDAGIVPAGSWYVDVKVQGPSAAQVAGQRAAYVLWGLPPFLRLKQQEHLDLVPLVVRDPLFQRVMVSIVVNPKKVPGTNADAAKAFEAYLLLPPTQAHIRAFRYPDLDQQAWWPAGRNNNARE
jgi:tungstate transport system substrate-binding protein